MRSVSMILLVLVFYSCKKDSVNKKVDDTTNYVYKDYITRDTIVKENYTLIFTNNASEFNTDNGNKVKSRMIDAFFNVYPKQTARYNPKAASIVYFLIDPTYNGVAETSGSKVKYSSKWMLNIPTDIDVVTHEVMHIVQAYTGNIPGWLVEGIADYARYKYGVDNATAGWSLPNYSTGQNYTDAYRVTARFLVWLEKNVKADLVKDLDAACRDNTYSSITWKSITGKTVDELWLLYTANPAL